MAIEFECPTCGGTLQVGDENAGRVIRCGGCLTMLRVPAVEPGSPTGGTAAPATPPSPFETDPLPTRQRPASPTPVQPPPDKPRRRRDPSDDRPRRTRQRPAQSGGYGVFFWLVVLGGVMLFFLFACCGGLLLMMPSAKWHTHESPKGGFKVELPAKTQPGIEHDAGLTLEKGEHIEGTTFRHVEHFIVIYRDIPSTKDRAGKEGQTDEDLLKKATKELLNATAAQGRPRSNPITVGGFPARELEYQGRFGSYTARIIVADTRLYFVFAAGVEPFGSPDVRRFLDSFTITEPKLVAEGKEREEKAKAKEREDKEKQGNLPVAPPPRPVGE